MKVFQRMRFTFLKICLDIQKKLRYSVNTNNKKAKKRNIRYRLAYRELSAGVRQWKESIELASELLSENVHDQVQGRMICLICI